MNLIKRDYTCSDADVERIMSKVEFDPNGGCWLWPAAKDKNYGKVWVRGSGPKGHVLFVHRVLYGKLKEPVSDQLVLDHKCRVKLCVNPNHLEPVVFRENLARGVDFNGHKTHCPKGHEFNEANTYKRKDYSGQNRGCKACRREQMAAFWASKGGQAAYNRARRQTQ